MKKLIILFLFLTTSSSAQKSIDWIGQVGLLELRNDNPIIQKTGTFVNGWKINFGSRINRQHFYLHPAIEFNLLDLEGSKHVEIFMMNPSQYTLSMPILLGWNIYSNNHFKLRTFVGPSGTYSIKIDQKKSLLNKSNYEPLSFACQFGIGFDFYPITLDFAYDAGISNYYANPSFKANIFHFGFGFIFDK